MTARPSLERRLIELEGVDGDRFPEAVALALGAEGVVVLEGGGDGPCQLVGVHPRVEAPGGNTPGAPSPPWADGLVLTRGDLSRLPLIHRFPTARWAIHGGRRCEGFWLGAYGRGRPPARLVNDPVLGEALLSRAAAAFGRGPLESADAMARLSHEFKTPLVSVKGYAELILDQAPDADPRIREWTRRIAVGANRLAGLFRRVASEARAGERVGYTPRPLDPARWVTWGIAEIRELANARRLAWSATVEPDCEPVRIDPDAARDALLELLQNAARATPDGGEVRVWAGPRLHGGRSGVCLEVEDDGVGIPAGLEAQRVFERYVTLTDTLAHHSGAFEYGASGPGLGLPMVRAIARAHGGDAWVEARGRDATVRPGTVARFWLPGAPPSVDDEGGDPATLRVLVVEPDPAARQLLVEALGCEARVTAVATAAAALDAWGAGRWDGCVVEPRLEGGGVNLVESLRGGARGAAVVVYTVAGPGQAEAYRAVGADACVVKPARTRLLVERLRSSVRRRGPR